MKINIIAFKRFFRTLLLFLVCLGLLGGSVIPSTDKIELVRSYTRMIEFDYINWMLNAQVLKNAQSALSAPRYLAPADQHRVVIDASQQVNRINELNFEIEKIYSDPQVTQPSVKAAAQLDALKALRADHQRLGALSESILQQQTSSVLASMNFTLGGQPLPPLIYHATELPLALIVSPRDKINQDANISLLPDLPLDQITALEQRVEKDLNVSALVVQIGGVGVYPPMVAESSDLPWVADTIAHEWTHNFLTLRPLGMNYDTTPELRTMNETTAAIVGGEVGPEVIRRFYPELLPKAQPSQPSSTSPSQPPSQPPPFDYRKEMHLTRVTVDQLLAAKKISEAEQYMEQRRQFFWDHGYLIRRLNQAYFAFNGAYADIPGGAAGEDPVGPAVRALRHQSGSLIEFLNRISWMGSFDQLKEATRH